MKIIALEGIDKCGKFTQTKLLYERMNSLSINTVKSEFHRYDTPTGELIRKFLYNNYNVDQYTIELIIAADKQAQMNWFRELDDSGVEFLILDRYIASQEVYSSCNGMPEEFIGSLLKQLIKPSLQILIDIPANESMLRKGKMPTDDKYEKNEELLRKVRIKYLNMFCNNFNSFVIDGMQTIEKIHDDIWNIVNSFYKF